MTREGLTSFIHAAEHSSSLRRELKKCNNLDSIVEIARNYGFSVSTKDFEEENTNSQIEFWFKNSKINPIK